MKCLLINAKEGTVTGVEFSDPDDLRKLVGGYIELAYYWPETGDTLYVDEHALLRNPTAFFHIPQRPDQALAGNGVLVGREEEGEQYPGGFTNLDPVLTAEHLMSIVRWSRVL